MLRQRRYEPNATYLQRLKRHYGVTDDPNLGGFLLPDGLFLDFSEGSGSRALDHRNIAGFSVRREQPQESRYDLLVRICKRTGMYRWMPEIWALQAWTPPTREQLITIRNLSRGRPLILEAERGTKSPTSRSYKHIYREYEWWNSEQAVRDILKFFD